MTELDFNTIKKEIDSFKDNRVFCVENIREKYFEEAFATINKIFNYSLESNDKLSKIKVQYVGEYVIFEFDKISYKTNKIMKNIGVSLNRKPIFLTSSSIYKSDNVIYKEESFASYDEETGHIINRIRIKDTDIDSLRLRDVSTLDKLLPTDTDYNKQEYTFYYDNGNLLALKNSEELYDGNNPRIETALKQISKITDNIDHKIDSIIGKDSVKEYDIKRKVM